MRGLETKIWRECCPSGVVHRIAQQKMLNVMRAWDIWDPRAANSHCDPTQRGRRPNHHVEAAVD